MFHDKVKDVNCQTIRTNVLYPSAGMDKRQPFNMYERNHRNQKKQRVDRGDDVRFACVLVLYGSLARMCINRFCIVDSLCTMFRL